MRPIGYLAALKKHFDSGAARAPIRRDAHVRGIRRGARRGAISLHRQGHRVLPHAVLAGDAALLRAQDADQRLRARVPHGVGREDVEVARHRLEPAALSGARHEPRVAALLHRGQAQRSRRGHRVQSRRLRRAREQRPRRQVRQHREPRGAVPVAQLRRPLSAVRLDARWWVGSTTMAARSRSAHLRPPVRRAAQDRWAADQINATSTRAAVGSSPRTRRSATSSIAW